MFDTVLVANRGEIALRIMRTLRGMGIRSVAVYSDADSHARHVVEADVAQRIGPAPPAQSYLSIERVIDAALATGATALHPGYGFLAENSGLASACAASGIVFIGPPPAAIDAMADKIRAKATVSSRGVRVVPGISGEGLTDAELADRAAEIGFPVLIKPSAGGGGKGMRLVARPADLLGEIASARREALGAFGDGTLLIERFIERPRHIEVQVLADSHGTIIHLGERECSLQRRHQKIVEEAPSPFLSDDDREVIGAQAVAAARACGYVNAGTVEFIVSGDKPEEAFFMEMNTRLQVEHPVTEMVWGVDLVELQLRIAAGDPLPFTQADLVPKGHSIEARIYAEDADRSFLPTGGTVVALQEPIGMPNIRVDSSLFVGAEIGSIYDPMLSKVIAWGRNRDSARRSLDRALAATSVLGVTTNVGFLRAILADPDVVAGRLDTSLVERIAGRTSVEPAPTHIAIAAALSSLDAQRLGNRTEPWGDAGGWRIGDAAWSTWHAEGGDGEKLQVRLRRTHAGTQIETFDAEGAVVGAALHLADGQGRIELGGRVYPINIAMDGRGVWVGWDGRSWSFTEPQLVSDEGARTGDSGDAIKSPMPGTIVSILVALGQQVADGQPVVVVEAMKMEHTLRAMHEGSVTEILVSVNDRVALNQLLAIIEPAELREEL